MDPLVPGIPLNSQIFICSINCESMKLTISEIYSIKNHTISRILLKHEIGQKYKLTTAKNRMSMLIRRQDFKKARIIALSLVNGQIFKCLHKF